GECPKEKHLAIERVWQCDHGSGRPDVANNAENLVLFEKLLHCRAGSRGIVAVIGGDEPELPNKYPAVCVGSTKCGLDTEPNILTKLLGRTGKRRHDPKADFGVGHAPKGRTLRLLGGRR